MFQPNRHFHLGCKTYTPNTFIGGVAATLGTPELIATKLGIARNRIKAFNVVGSDIAFCVIGGSYTLISWSGNTNITYFHDLDGLVTACVNYCFRFCSNLTEVKLKNLLIIPANCFDGTALQGMDNDLSSVIQVGNITAAGAFNNISATVPTVIHLPNLVTCTGPGAAANFGGHATLSNNITFNVPLALMTSNAGKPDTALTTSNLKAVNINYIGYTDDLTFNTEIGNYTGGFTNKGQLANFLGFGSGAIVNYRIDGTDTKFKMLTNYTLASSKFSGNTSISHYFDLDGFVTSVGRTFENASNFKNIKVKNATILNSFCLRSSGFIGDNSDFSSVTSTGLEIFTSCTSVTTINFPAMTNLGGTVANNGVFNNIKTGATIIVPRALETSNAGAEEGDIAYARTSRGATIVYID